MKKRWRKPIAKDSQLKAQWGSIDGEVDLCYVWGAGIFKCDSHLIHNMFRGLPLGKHPDYSPITYLEEFEKRGYDLTTLKFSIEKKK